MRKLDPRSINQHVKAVDAKAAAARLGVKVESIYAYASRGRIRVVPGPTGRQRLYLVEDLDRMRAISQARAGQLPTSSSREVVETAITLVDATRGPVYRGTPAVELAKAKPSFEAVCELLWTGALPTKPTSVTVRPVANAEHVARAMHRGQRPMDLVVGGLALIAADESTRFSPVREQELARARWLVRQLAALPGFTHGARGYQRSVRQPSVASTLVAALGGKPSPQAETAVNAALVLMADQGVNESSYSARLAASTGADLFACVTAALSVFSGPRHGGACDAVEVLVGEVGSAKAAPAFVSARVRRGEEVPGFHDPRFPKGDPRAPMLLAWAERLGPTLAGVKAIRALVSELDAAGLGHPTVEVGLVALARALGLGVGAATAMCAVGRSAGWLAHAFEQRESGEIRLSKTR